MDTSSGGDGNAGAFAGAIMASPRGYLMSGKIMLTATLVFFTIALIILFLYLYGRWYLMRRQLRGFVFAGTPTLTAASKALDPVVLKSLPVVIFAGKRGDEAIECAVCLSEVAAGEKVRILPRCEHCFHIECIDMWFGSHATCPLCRVQVEAELDPPAAKAGEMRSESRGEEAPSTSTSTSTATARGGEEEMGTKSPRSAILVLRRILSRDLGSFGGGTVVEPDLERGERLGI